MKNSRFCVVFIVLFLSGIDAAWPQSIEELEHRTTEILNNWNSQRSERPKAQQYLKQILEQDPNSAFAYHGLARLALFAGYRFNTGEIPVYSDGVITEATKLLDYALALDPSYSEAYVLYGSITVVTSQFSLGLILLDEAERLGAKSLWLPMNRAKLFALSGNLDAARKQYQIAIRQVRKGSDDHIAALNGLVNISTAYEEADKLFREIIRLRPNHEWSYGNYAGYLLDTGDFDGAIRNARAAIKIRDYSIARRTLANALYAKSSILLINDKDSVASEVYFLEAQRIQPDLSQVFLSAAPNENRFETLLALHQRGVDINTRGQDGGTALHEIFMWARNIDHIKQMLRLGADPNIQNRMGATPFHMSISGGTELVTLMLDNGANPNIPMVNGVFPLEVAKKNGYHDVAKQLQAVGARSMPPEWQKNIDGIAKGDSASLQWGFQILQGKGKNAPDEVKIAFEEALIHSPDNVVALSHMLMGTQEFFCGLSNHKDQTTAARSLEERWRSVEAARKKQIETTRDVSSALIGCYHRLWKTREALSNVSPDSQPAAKESEQSRLAEARSFIGKIRWSDPSLSKANKIIYELLKADPNNIEAKLLLGQIEMIRSEIGDRNFIENSSAFSWNSLERGVENALSVDIANTDALVLYGRAMIKQGRVSVGRLLTSHARNLGSSNPWIEVTEADALNLENKYTAAAEKLRAIPTAGQGYWVQLATHRALITSLLGQKKLGMARASQKKKADQNSSDINYVRPYMKYLLLRVGDVDEAFELAQVINGMNGSAPVDKKLFRLAFMAKFAQFLEVREMRTEAEKTLGQLRQTWPDRSVDWNWGIMTSMRYNSLFPMVKTLCEAGVPIDNRDENGATALLYAIQSGAIAQVDQILSCGADVNAKFEWGITPLLLAVLTKREKIAIKLIDAGASTMQELPTGGSIARSIDYAEMPDLAKYIDSKDGDAQSIWRKRINGIDAAYTTHLRAAGQEADNSEIRLALQNALKKHPLNVLRTENIRRNLSSLCKQSAETESDAAIASTADRLSAVEDALEKVAILGNSDIPEVLHRCRNLLVKQQDVYLAMQN